MTTKMTKKDTSGWNLHNSYACLPEKFFSTLKPAPVPAPRLSVINLPLIEELGLDPCALQSEKGVAILSGNSLPENSIPLAQAYAGHQFGHFTMLGDGRALLLGEQITPSGECFDIQLKGSGKTPYSRGGDGRATLGPMLREYIISEAMHGLGIPTSRSLGVVTTGESVIRETALPGAVLTRVASSHIRVGTFEYALRWGSLEDLQALADYTIQRHFPQAISEDNPYSVLLQEVIKNQAALIAGWQLMGFIHGVMNTDNMTISGETIDYGPCAFMDHYDPATVFSSIDVHGRYAYENQPSIGGWNLARFAETLLPLLHEDQKEAIKIGQEAVSGFEDLYHCNWLAGMKGKLGLLTDESGDEELIQDLLHSMQRNGADYTNTFRGLTAGKLKDMDEEFISWYERWQARLSRQKEENLSSRQLMAISNPAIIPRNHRVEEALQAAVQEGDYSVMEKLLHALNNPYAYTEEQEEYTALPSPSAPPYRTYCGT